MVMYSGVAVAINCEISLSWTDYTTASQCVQPKIKAMYKALNSVFMNIMNLMQN